MGDEKEEETKEKKNTFAVSGIVTTGKADRVIPATRRADGTMRVERKVKPGYTPPEDIAAYKTGRTKQLERSKGYIPGLSPKPKQAVPLTTTASEEERERKVRLLERRIQQAEDLQRRKEQGHKLGADELVRVMRMEDMVKDLESLKLK